MPTRFRVNFVTLWYRTQKRRPNSTMQGRQRAQVTMPIPIAVCITILITWLEASYLSSMTLLILKAVEGAATL